MLIFVSNDRQYTTNPYKHKRIYLICMDCLFIHTICFVAYYQEKEN